MVPLPTNFPPDAPKRIRRDNTRPPAKRKAQIGKKNWKRNSGPTTGLFLRDDTSNDIDYVTLARGIPKCDNVSCTLSCCDPEQHRGWASWSATDQRKYLRRCHDQYREAYVSNGGHHGCRLFCGTTWSNRLAISSTSMLLCAVVNASRWRRVSRRAGAPGATLCLVTSNATTSSLSNNAPSSSRATHSF